MNCTYIYIYIYIYIYKLQLRQRLERSITVYIHTHIHIYRCRGGSGRWGKDGFLVRCVLGRQGILRELRHGAAPRGLHLHGCHTLFAVEFAFVLSTIIRRDDDGAICAFPALRVEESIQYLCIRKMTSKHDSVIHESKVAR